MKYLFFIAFVFIIKFNLFSLNTSVTILFKQKTLISDTSYIIIGMLESADSTINKVKLQIETVGNCKVINYCKRYMVYVVKYTKIENQSPEALFDLIQTTVGTPTLYHKIGSLEEITNTCNTEGIEVINNQLNPTKAK